MRKRKVLAAFYGMATYYSDSLAGNHTASGEIYRPRALTAANRTLPFGTIIRVVRTDTRLGVVVRINDRGPFGNRKMVLDLSHAAAERLRMMSDGVVRVRVEILKYGAQKTQAKR
jgi:rare lipoprotein A